MKHTNIGWTNSTVNGSSGCDGCELWHVGRVSCYAGHLHENRLARTNPKLYAPNFDEVRMIPGRFQRAANWGPLTPDEWKDKPWFEGRSRHIFVGDMGDFLSDDVTDEFLERELLGAITSKNGKRHVWQLLTKRPERLASLSEKWGGLPDNVIAMTTITEQRYAAPRISHLLRVRCKWRGLSIEPMVSAVDLGPWTEEGLECPYCYWQGTEKNSECCEVQGEGQWRCPKCGEFCCHTPIGELLGAGVHWVVCGGESGANARPMHPDWARSLRDQCKAAGVPFFFKQWGEWINLVRRGHDPETCYLQGQNGQRFEMSEVPDDWPSGKKTSGFMQVFESDWGLYKRVGKKASGRLLDGVEHSEFPEVRT